MCNLYTTRLSRDEVDSLFLHRELIGTNFKDEQRVYPNGEAPVMVLEADGRIAVKGMRWGFPKPPTVPGSGYVTNVRNIASNYWKPWLKAPSVHGGEGRQCRGRRPLPGAGLALRRARQEHWEEGQRHAVDQPLVRAARRQPVRLRRDLAQLDGRSRHQDQARHRPPHGLFVPDDRPSRGREADP